MVANLVSQLALPRRHRIIQDYSQCVLLLRSTRNSPNFAGPYVTALQAQHIPVYNPRSKDYLQQEDVSTIGTVFEACRGRSPGRTRAWKKG